VLRDESWDALQVDLESVIGRDRLERGRVGWAAGSEQGAEAL
jgi:hypothetical protein